MPYTPFFPTADQLPATLPLFPLENAVVMPQAELPLNIFEPRYLNMVTDALASHHLVGMIQPLGRQRGDVPALHRTGCAGRITSFRETGDGRILITLTGVCRFDIGEELPTIRGYRLAKPEWQRFLDDLDTGQRDDESQQPALLGLLRDYFKRQKLVVDWEVVEQLSLLELVHTMTVLLPFEPMEKQAILEGVTLPERTGTLRSLLEFRIQQGNEPLRH